MVAVDGSRPSLRAMKSALQLAAPGDDVIVLHVVTPGEEESVLGRIRAAVEAERLAVEVGLEEENNGKMGEADNDVYYSNAEDGEGKSAEPYFSASSRSTAGRATRLRFDRPPPSVRLEVVDMVSGSDGVGETICKFASRLRSGPAHFLALGTSGRSADVFGSPAALGSVALHCLRKATSTLVFPQVLSA